MIPPVHSVNHISYFILLFNYKARDNTNKKITIYYVVWIRLTRVGCFYWLAHYKRMRIADKKIYIVHFKSIGKSQLVLHMGTIMYTRTV